MIAHTVRNNNNTIKLKLHLYTFTKTNREINPLSRRHFILKLTVSL